jgi:hypothetical protein
MESIKSAEKSSLRRPHVVKVGGRDSGRLLQGQLELEPADEEFELELDVSSENDLSAIGNWQMNIDHLAIVNFSRALRADGPGARACRRRLKVTCRH